MKMLEIERVKCAQGRKQECCISFLSRIKNLVGFFLISIILQISTIGHLSKYNG